ncbi:MAG TPA: hypothetical protein PLS73_01455 [Saprospiraceae bacterium]|nr:hypothetical protein [Saprospiraceae bacterium]
MLKNLLLTIAFTIAVANLYGQEKPGLIHLDSNAPEFMHLIFETNPNVFKVEKAYSECYKNKEFVKNAYTQYYKLWMHWAQNNMDNNGNIYFPSPQEKSHEELQRLQLRKNASSLRAPAANWKFVGPSQTFHTDGITKVTWQTNVYSIDIAPSDSTLLYAGGESGGLWKTTDRGKNWLLTTANVLHDAFGAVRIHPKNPDTVYAATSGKIIKTNDGGKTWSTVYSESGLWVHDLAIKPSNGQIVLAASNKGMLQTANGGLNWKKVFIEECWTVKFKLNAPATSFCVRLNGAVSDFMKSVNDGASWTSVSPIWMNPGAGESVTGALIAQCPSNSKKMYVYLCGTGGSLNGYVGVFVSSDDGLQWNNTNASGLVGGTYSIPTHTNLMANNGTTGFNQGFYDMAIVVNPKNENELIAGGTSWFKSIDGGVNWTSLGGYVGNLPWSHPDIQCLAARGSDLWIGSDGGINYSTDFGLTSEARMDGISGADLWGFDSGWNEDILVGGRYHNGNMAWHESFPANTFYRMGGAEAATGYVNPGPGRKTYFSDIGGYALKAGLMNGVSYFPVGLFPNESYAYYANSQMTWHPQCWNIIFLGRENKIWKSMDGGATFQLLYNFPGNNANTIFEIEVSRSHPEIMYCSQWDGTDDSMWRSSDNGKSWKKLTPLPLPNNNDRVKMSLSASNPDELWVAVTYGSNGKKIYKTIDGGLSWINLTTPKLDNVTISDILHQLGTQGGVYLGTKRGVYYRNDLMSEWEAYSDGLPVSAETNRLKPFYRDGKIRNGCWGFGVWESNLYENSTVIPQAMVNKLESFCIRDTFYFDDYSNVNHSGASWTWTVPDANYLTGQNTRTPKVLFKSTGLKQIVMSLKTASGTYKDTLYVKVNNQCEKDSLPGSALLLNGINSYAQIPALGIQSNNFTMMAWVKSNATQSDFAGILFMRGGSSTSGLSVLTNGDLRYHWNDNGYNWVSKARLIPGEWTHLAMVVTPTSLTIYKDGVAYTRNDVFAPSVFDSPIAIGADLNGGARFFRGEIDEVCTYNRSLSVSEIREIMHLSRSHTANPGMLSYYQFNEGADKILDKENSFHGSLGGNAILIPSTAPIGPGNSLRMDIRTKGTYQFGATGLTVETEDSGVFPNGELCVSRINHIPINNFNPDNRPVSKSYWILHNFGSNISFTPFKNLKFDEIGPVRMQTQANELNLFKRGPNIDTASWMLAINGSSLQAGINASAQFTKTKVQESSQLLISKSAGDTLFVGVKNPNNHQRPAAIEISPNPLNSQDQLTIKTTMKGEIVVKLMDDRGRILKLFKFNEFCETRISDLKPATYLVSFESKDQLIFKRLVVVD